MRGLKICAVVALSAISAVIPAGMAATSGDTKEIDRRVDELLSKMTLHEKVLQLRTVR